MSPLLLLLLACRGPDPRVVDHRVEGGPPLAVDVVLENDGGDGQVDVIVTARSEGGEVLGRKDEQAELEAGERRHVRVVVPVPDGTKAEDVRLEIEARYPPG